MEVKDLYQFFSVNEWRGYFPMEPQYVKNAPHEILAGHKIFDTYSQLMNARSSLYFIDVEDYGEMLKEHNDISKTYIKSKFVFDALAHYNYCIDLSWQFLYLYYGEGDYGMIQDSKRYIEATKSCNLESLRYRLCLGKKDEIYNHITRFLSLDTSIEVRQRYNYLKHRGTYHVDGLGIPDSDAFPMVIGKKFQPRMIKRETVNVKELQSKLIQFDISFVKYFNELIRIMPNDFTNNTFDLRDLREMRNRLEKR